MCIDRVCVGFINYEKIKILIPVFNDWQSLSKLLNNIDKVINDIDYEISIIIVMAHQPF